LRRFGDPTRDRSESVSQHLRKNLETNVEHAYGPVPLNLLDLEMGPRNIYKDMLNNTVSPIDHVVMNHRNYARTNDI
jgi:hypothetical protein